jgi:hypothetical protein
MAQHRVTGTMNQLTTALGEAGRYLCDFGGQVGSIGGEFMKRRGTRPETGTRKYERRFQEDTSCTQLTATKQMKLCVRHHRRKGTGDCDGKRELNSEWSINDG